MEATLENVDSCEVIVTVSVPAEEFNTELEGGFKNLSQNARMKGFRPGKIPRKVLEKAHGETLRQETQQQFVQRGLQEVVTDNELRPVGQPRMSLEDLNTEDDGSFTAKVTLSLHPKYTLGEYKGMTAEAAKVEVHDDEVQNALGQFRESQARPEVAKDGLLEDGMAMARVEVLNGEDSLMSRDGVRLAPGTTPPGLDEEAYKAAMLGSKEGDSHDIAMVFPEDFQPEELRGKDGICRIAITQAFDMTRPTDEELMGMLQAENAEEMDTKVREDILRQKQAHVNSQVELNLMEQLIANHDIDVPARLIEEQTNVRKAAMQQQLVQGGTSEEDAKAQIEAQAETIHTEGVHHAKARFLLEDVAQAEDLQVKNEDVARKFQEIAQRNRTSVEEVQKYYQEQNLLHQLAMEILELKVRAFLREHATITEVA